MHIKNNVQVLLTAMFITLGTTVSGIAQAADTIKVGVLRSLSGTCQYLGFDQGWAA